MLYHFKNQNQYANDINFIWTTIYFYVKDHKPIHIHIENSDGEAKFEIENEIVLVYNHGLKLKDLRLAQSILEENKENFINEWKRIFENEDGAR